jgi:hypothetical protein
MEWAISIIREGAGFRLIEGVIPPPAALGFVVWDGERLHTHLAEPLNESESAFLSEAIVEWVVGEQQRVARIAETMVKQFARIGQMEG